MEEAALEVIEVEVQVAMEAEDAATRVEEDTAIMARKTYLSSFTLPSRNIPKKALNHTFLCAQKHLLSDKISCFENKTKL